ncbi:MAG: hypothetical protein MZV63_62610 [Marinilabiliales bacterium]|nr:hypothetical protein [Marinilabiliales bacterium]
MIEADNVTEVMSVSVFANILIFLLFNRFDMLQGLQGRSGHYHCMGLRRFRHKAALG